MLLLNFLLSCGFHSCASPGCRVSPGYLGNILWNVFANSKRHVEWRRNSLKRSKQNWACTRTAVISGHRRDGCHRECVDHLFECRVPLTTGLEGSGRYLNMCVSESSCEHWCWAASPMRRFSRIRLQLCLGRLSQGVKARHGRWSRDS